MLLKFGLQSYLAIPTCILHGFLDRFRSSSLLLPSISVSLTDFTFSLALLVSSLDVSFIQTLPLPSLLIFS